MSFRCITYSYNENKTLISIVYKRFSVVCEKWELEFKFRKRITNLEDLSEFLAKEFPHEEVIMLIFDKLHLLREDPKKYAKEKLKNQTDKDGRCCHLDLTLVIFRNGVNKRICNLVLFHRAILARNQKILS